MASNSGRSAGLMWLETAGAGYRVDWGWKATLKSFFQLHNESFNVWTHVAGFLLILVIYVIAAMYRPTYGIDYMPWASVTVDPTDKVAFPDVIGFSAPTRLEYDTCTSLDNTSIPSPLGATIAERLPQGPLGTLIRVFRERIGFYDSLSLREQDVVLDPHVRVTHGSHARLAAEQFVEAFHHSFERLLSAVRHSREVTQEHAQAKLVAIRETVFNHLVSRIAQFNFSSIAERLDVHTHEVCGRVSAGTNKLC